MSFEKGVPEIEFTKAELDHWFNWVDSLDLDVKQVAEKVAPWHVYRIKLTGRLCLLDQFVRHPDGKVAILVRVSSELNPHSPLAILTGGGYLVAADLDEIEAVTDRTKAS